MGAQYRWTQRLRLGFAVLNLNRPSVGLSEASPIARTVALGLASELGPGTLSADLCRREVLNGYTDAIAALGVTKPGARHILKPLLGASLVKREGGHKTGKYRMA